MGQLTYEQRPYYVVVFLDGKRIGKIKAWRNEGFRYYRDGWRDGGRVFPTVEACKAFYEQA